MSLPCTNPGLFPLCQYTSKLLSCKVTSEVLFNLSVLVCLHAWPGACGCGVPFPGGLNEGQESSLSPYLFLPAVSELGGLPQHVGVHATTIRSAVPYGGVEKTLPRSWIWKMCLVSSGTDSKCTLVWLESRAAPEDRVLCLP